MIKLGAKEAAGQNLEQAVKTHGRSPESTKLALPSRRHDALDYGVRLF